MVRYLSFCLFLFCLIPPVIAAERYVLLGLSAQQADYSSGDSRIDSEKGRDTGYQLRMAARNSYGENQQHLLGLGLDVQRFIGDLLLGFRALEYQYQFNCDYRAGAFIGAMQLDSGAAQTGYYGGLNVSRLNTLLGADAVLELQYGHGLARDRLLPEDPQGRLPDMFMNVYVFNLGLAWRF